MPYQVTDGEALDTFSRDWSAKGGRGAFAQQWDPEAREDYTFSFLPYKDIPYIFRLRGFDIEKVKEGAKYLVGYHDFTTFKKFDKLKENKQNRRELKSVVVRPGAPLVTSYSSAQEQIWDHWEVEFKGRAFVHNQVLYCLKSSSYVSDNCHGVHSGWRT